MKPRHIFLTAAAAVQSAILGRGLSRVAAQPEPAIGTSPCQMNSDTQPSPIPPRLPDMACPAPPARQQKDLCELYAYWSGDGYELINNLWGKDSATSGSQCTYLDDCTNTGVQWHTTWDWQGAPNNVKSFPYSGRQVTKGRTISSISSMPTSVTWGYDNENVRANVAYDVFTSADPNHPNTGGDYELMIWLGRYGSVYPIGSAVCSVTIAGRIWNLWVGYNGKMKVYSFVPPSGCVKSFSADVKDFFDYLQHNQQFPASSQNLIVFQVGTEAFTGGPATFTVSQFYADVI